MSACKPVDRIQPQLGGYAAQLRYEDLDAETVHAAKVRVIDTLGALIGGFFGEASPHRARRRGAHAAGRRARP